MKHHAKQFFTFMLIQATMFSVLVFNFRSIAKGTLGPALMSEALYTMLNFYMVRRIARADDSVWACAGYVIGSMIGTLIGMSVGK